MLCCCVAMRGERQREATGGGGGLERRVGANAKQDVAGLALQCDVGAEQRRRGTEQASRLEEGEKDRFAISEISGT